MRPLLLLLTLALTGCGPVVGDPCTVASQCAQGVCVNGPFAPGGLCSLTCTVGGAACPAGSTCVMGVIAADVAGCLHRCAADADCRAGYVCRTEKDSMTKVCVGPAGIP